MFSDKWNLSRLALTPFVYALPFLSKVLDMSFSFDNLMHLSIWGLVGIYCFAFTANGADFYLGLLLMTMVSGFANIIGGFSVLFITSFFLHQQYLPIFVILIIDDYFLGNNNSTSLISIVLCILSLYFLNLPTLISLSNQEKIFVSVILFFLLQHQIQLIQMVSSLSTSSADSSSPFSLSLQSIIVSEVALLLLLFTMAMTVLFDQVISSLTSRYHYFISSISSSPSSSFSSWSVIHSRRCLLFFSMLTLIIFIVGIPYLTYLLHDINPFVWLLKDIFHIHLLSSSSSSSSFKPDDYEPYLPSFTCYWIALIISSIYLADYCMRSWLFTKIWGRKVFHGLVVLMFIPALLWIDLHHPDGGSSSNDDRLVAFLSLSLGGALCIFILMEFIRLYLYFEKKNEKEEKNAVQAIKVNQYFDMFLLPRELPHTPTTPSSSLTNNEEKIMIDPNQTVVTAHISLLIATASTVWISILIKKHNRTIQSVSVSPLSVVADPLLPYLGLITVGIGDALAAVIGLKWGRISWLSILSSRSKEEKKEKKMTKGKTIEGSLAGFFSMLIAACMILYIIHGWEAIESSIIQLLITFAMTSLAEVFIEGNDNLILPFYTLIVYSLL